MPQIIHPLFENMEMNFKVVLQRLCIKALATKQLAHNDFLFVTGEQERKFAESDGFGWFWLETAPKTRFSRVKQPLRRSFWSSTVVEEASKTEAKR